MISGGWNMNRLYKALEKIDDIEGRRIAINDYLATGDITDKLPSGVRLKDEQELPDEKGSICFPFVVGNKYFLKGKRNDKENSAYLIGIAQAAYEPLLLIMRPDARKPQCVKKDEMELPVHTANRRYIGARNAFEAEILKRWEVE